MDCNTPVVAAEELSGDATEVYYGLLKVVYDGDEGDYMFVDADSGHTFAREPVSQFGSIEALATKIDTLNNEILEQL